MAMVIPKKICPIMSKGTDIKYCDTECQLYARYHDDSAKRLKHECALLLIAESITHKQLQ